MSKPVAYTIIAALLICGVTFLCYSMFPCVGKGNCFTSLTQDLVAAVELIPVDAANATETILEDAIYQTLDRETHADITGKEITCYKRTIAEEILCKAGLIWFLVCKHLEANINFC